MKEKVRKKESSFVKPGNHGTAGLSVKFAAFFSALLLSLLCGLFYNAWKYEVERIEAEEGSWHSRFLGELSAEEMEMAGNFANVEDVVCHEKGAAGTEKVTDFYFDDSRAAVSDTPHIAEQLGIPQERIVYHAELLSMYLVRAPGDTAPRLLFPLLLLIALTACFSLILIIHHSFAVSMNARIHQLGILASVGATPGQIRSYLMREAAALCAVPVIAGNLLGIGGSAGLVCLSNRAVDRIDGRHEAVFGYHPLILGLTLLATILTIGISAWLPARRLGRLTPLEAIRNTGEAALKRPKNFRLLAGLFGIEGELAGSVLKAQKKALRTASLSFLVSFLAFAAMECVFTLSRISIEETYFARYQDVWDIMVTVKDTGADSLEAVSSVRELDGVRSAIVYQKAAAKRLVAEAELSGEMKAFGGFAAASAGNVQETESGWLVNAPLVILDDESFAAYCEQIGVAPRLDGAVVLNRMRDVANPDFRHPVFVPYLTGKQAASVLRRADGKEASAEVPVLSYTQEVPALREEYVTLDYYELVHFLPVSLWKEIKGQIGGAEEDSYLCVRGREGVTQEELTALQEEIGGLLGGNHTIEQENRIQAHETNNRQIQGLMAVYGGFCVLLAMIGVGSVFSYTLGFVRQRRREFARYLSVGMTPRQLRKMFCLEAVLIAGRPILLSIPPVVCVVGLLLRASYMEVGAFMDEAPLLPIGGFLLAILGFVALAYRLAWRQADKISLAEVVKWDAMT